MHSRKFEATPNEYADGTTYAAAFPVAQPICSPRTHRGPRPAPCRCEPYCGLLCPFVFLARCAHRADGSSSVRQLICNVFIRADAEDSDSRSIRFGARSPGLGRRYRSVLQHSRQIRNAKPARNRFRSGSCFLRVVHRHRSFARHLSSDERRITRRLDLQRRDDIPRRVDALVPSGGRRVGSVQRLLDDDRVPIGDADELEP
jgi:hypothetical protein